MSVSTRFWVAFICIAIVAVFLYPLGIFLASIWWVAVCLYILQAVSDIRDAQKYGGPFAARQQNNNTQQLPQPSKVFVLTDGTHIDAASFTQNDFGFSIRKTNGEVLTVKQNEVDQAQTEWANQ